MPCRYDAVTTAGELRWQNKLCPEANGPFFDLADALFLNYCWKPAALPETAAAAGARAHDVFVGVDVYGRGCFGGGGHNTHLALAAAKAAGLSAALFAPGWVHENLDKARFPELQEQWWNKVSRYKPDVTYGGTNSNKPKIRWSWKVVYVCAWASLKVCWFMI